MRILTTLYGVGRRPQKEHEVPFQEILPLRLKNTVSGKADSGSDVCCLHELSVLFACLKDHEFAEKFCEKEISSFQNCYKMSLDKKFEAKKTVNKGIVTPGKDLNYRQLNKFMRRFPNPK